MELETLRQDQNIPLDGGVPNDVVDEPGRVPPKPFVIIEQGFALFERLLKVARHVGQRLELGTINIIICRVARPSPGDSLVPGIVGDFAELLQALAKRLNFPAEAKVLEICFFRLNLCQ